VEIDWLDPALEDLDRARRWIALANPSAADRLVLRIVERVEQLARLPQLGRPGRVKGTRELVVPQTSYIVAYRIREEVVEILGVVHGARQWPESFG
jgi:toxin ParE1/3/4